MTPTTEGGEFDDDVAGVLRTWGPSKSPVPFFPSVEVKTQQVLNPLSHGRQTLWVENHLQAPIVKAKKQQSKDVQNEFNMRLTQIVTQFKEQGLNNELYYKNKEMGETNNIVPTSAITYDLLTLGSYFNCIVLEVKVIEGHGTTIDVLLVNGVLHEGDQIVVYGMKGPIVASIRALLTPHPMKELRVKGTYLHHKEIKAAQGIKITAQHAIAGTSLYVVGPNDDLEDIKETTMEDMKSVMSRVDKSDEGVCVQASTLGSLEALLEFLKTP
ncbi:eukaryotic translation initiation factor 5B-like [Humulus lupulus]|uniref:eukaryotic translation initiation factor 5B-like n=1 Tax=Humulus lupulus TaxID=3486 RepID=UPI002B414ABD|nr:eukaryotic translation initiation factor 5B-like [Humulus lupulus]